MSTTLKNILERYARLEKEFRAIHEEIAEAQKILVDGEDESPIVQEFSISLWKNKRYLLSLDAGFFRLLCFPSPKRTAGLLLSLGTDC